MSDPRPGPPRPAGSSRDAARPATPPTTAPAPRISSAVLFRDALEVQIEHNGALYRLKQTALGKLILTK